MVRVVWPPRYPSRKVWDQGADPRRPGARRLMIADRNEHIGHFSHLLGALR
jgi:hypothetical protein